MGIMWALNSLLMILARVHQMSSCHRSNEVIMDRLAVDYYYCAFRSAELGVTNIKSQMPNL